jgi:hypothetical protein
MKVATIDLVSAQIDVFAKKDWEGELLGVNVVFQQERGGLKVDLPIHISDISTLGEFLLEISKRLGGHQGQLEIERKMKRAKFWEFKG